MCVCILYGICDKLSRDKRLNPDNAFCFGFILMPDLSTNHIGCWHSLPLFISGLFMYGYRSNLSRNKACDICKTKRMVIKLILLGYVNNYDKNRYLEKNSKAAVHREEGKIPFEQRPPYNKYRAVSVRMV